ncbi:hypothetical protein ABIB25_000989 [Nakamurella sp. UYEF19]
MSAGWGWIVPLVVEAGVLTSAALAWVRSGEGLGAATETAVMTGLLALSVVVNVAHAAHGTLLGRVVAAVPPVVLLVAVEGLLREQRRTAAAAFTAIGSLVLVGDEEPGEPAARLDAPVTVAVGSTALADAVDRDQELDAVPLAAEQPSERTSPDAREPNRTDAWAVTSPKFVAARGAEPPVVPDGPPGEQWISAIERQVQVATAADPTPAGAPTKPPAEPVRSAGAHPPPTVIVGPIKPEELASQVRKAYRAGVPVTGRSVAGWLGVSESTGQRRLKKVLNEHTDLAGYAARDAAADQTLNRAN